MHAAACIAAAGLGRDWRAKACSTVGMIQQRFPRPTTADGLEQTRTVNVPAPFLLSAAAVLVVGARASGTWL